MKKAIAISVARPEDLPDLIRLVRAYYRYDGIRYRRALVPAALERLLRGDAPARVWMARDELRAAGYIAFSYHYDAEFGGLEGVITDLFVHRVYQGQGLGSRLLETVEDYCRSAGIGSIELQVIEKNRAAAQFYSKHGFRRLGRIIMARDIAKRRSGGKVRKR